MAIVRKPLSTPYRTAKAKAAGSPTITRLTAETGYAVAASPADGLFFMYCYSSVHDFTRAGLHKLAAAALAGSIGMAHQEISGSLSLTKQTVAKRTNPVQNKRVVNEWRFL